MTKFRQFIIHIVCKKKISIGEGIPYRYNETLVADCTPVVPTVVHP